MRSSLKRKFTRRRLGTAGFTLSEVLIAVAILVVLMSVAIPQVVSYQRDLKVTLLDETAKELYAAAQNSLTRMGNNDSTDALKNAAPMGTEPSDFGIEADWGAISAGRFYYTLNGEDAAKLLLPLGSIEDPVRIGGYYIIEYDLKSASVYGVFYAEKPLSYADFSTLDALRDDKAARAAAQIGYYGGSAVDRDDFERAPTPILTVENGDELLLNISGVGIDHTVRLLLSDGAHSMELVYDGSLDYFEYDPVHGYTLTLDTLRAGAQFKDRFADLTPGADIEATVYFEAANKLAAFSTVSFNSLFAARTGDGGETAEISWARHLQNLDKIRSGVTEDVTAAVQTANISLENVADFVSIENAELDSYDGGKRTVTKLSGDNGLFAKFTGSELKDVYLVNPRVSGTGADYVGALAGYAENCDISGCQVYCYLVNGNKVDYDNYTNYGLNGGTEASGGLIGSAVNCRVTGSFAALPRLSGATAAGLIGEAKGSEITDCYAACDELRGIAKLIGSADNGTAVKNCYAVGNAPTANVALPFVQGGSLSDCYCAFSYINGEVKNLASEYLVYAGDGSMKTSNSEKLKDDMTGTWGSCSAALTRPYSKLLDGRAYPFGSIPGLRHWGSWPMAGGLEITVVLRMENGQLDRNAGTVMAQSEKLTLFYSSNMRDEEEFKFEAPARELLTFTVAPSGGYGFENAQVDDGAALEHKTVNGNYVFSFNPMSDCTVYITFAQTAYTLSCEQPVNEDNYGSGVDGSSYTVAAGSLKMQPGRTGKAGVGTQVVVAPKLATSLWYVAGVSYSVGSTEHEAQRNPDGSFSFAMPEGDTSVRVRYTQKHADFKVNYFLMSDSGSYIATPSSSTTRTLGVGVDINEDLLDYFTALSSLPKTVNGVPCIMPDENRAATVAVGGSAIGLPYTTSADDDSKTFTVNIYFARAEFKVKLIAGGNVDTVAFSGTLPAATVESSFRYGAWVTATASLSSNSLFTSWEEANGRVIPNSNNPFRFSVPASDLVFTAKASATGRLVTLTLYKNGDSWLFNDRKGFEDLKYIVLKNATDASADSITMTNEDDLSCSYIVHSTVPAGRYNVLVKQNGEYKPYLVNKQPLVINCTNGPATGRLDFYSVSFFPNTTSYTGTVPAGTVWPSGATYKLPGNTGLLVNTGSGPKVFAGWLDAYVSDLTPEIYNVEKDILIERRMDLYANWVDGLDVTYDGNGAEGGTLPTDATKYASGAVVEIQYPSDFDTPLYRTGYDFKGWNTERDGSGTEYRDKATNPTYTMTSSDVIFYAQWKQASYNVTCYKDDGSEQSTASMGYNDTFTVPSSPPTGQRRTFVGWSTTRGGPVEYLEGDTITVRKDINLYARTVSRNNVVEVTYNYPETVRVMTSEEHWDRRGNYYPAVYEDISVNHSVTVRVGKNIPYRLHCGSAPEGILGWSRGSVSIQNVHDYTYGNNYSVAKATYSYYGSPMYCDEDGYSYETYTFSENTNLFCLGRVFNTDSSSWYNTLKQAVSGADNGDTLMVYGDTQESGQITIDKNLTILANGHRRISWSGSGTIPTNQDNFRSDGKTFYDVHGGCLSIDDYVTVNLGADGEDYQSNSLTFDAAQKGRVICMEPSSNLYMFEGVNLINGWLENDLPDDKGIIDPGKVDQTSNYEFFGGGVFVNQNATFYMRGGEISGCSAPIGGGVYLIRKSQMVMGRMTHSDSVGQGYAETAAYYREVSTNVYELAENADGSNYTDYFIPWGNPRINNNSSFRSISGSDTFDSGHDGGGGLCSVDLLQNALLLYSGEICYNTTTGNGGGILTDAGPNDDKLRIYNVYISGNRANANGGGVFQWQGTLYIYNSVIFQNYAGNWGGGVCLNISGNETSNIEFYYGDISNNSAGVAGGAVYAKNGARLLLFGGNTTGNTAPNGDGIYMAGGSSGNYLQLSGGNISYNGEGSDYYEDIWLGNNKVITVPNTGLSLDASVHSKDGGYQITVTCQTPENNKTVVKYASAAAYDESDANYFVYSNKGYSIAPRGTNELRLVRETGKREVRFYLNNGDPDAYESKTYNIGTDALTDIPDAVDPPQAENRKHMGWGTAADTLPTDKLLSYIVSDLYNQSLYAIWDDYTLTYDVTGIDVALEVPAPQKGPGPVTLTMITNPQGGFHSVSADNTLKYNHFFLGWSETKGAATAQYPVGQTHNIALDRDITLYAVWNTETVPGTVRYEPNFGAASGTGGAQDVPVSNGCSFAAMDPADASGTMVFSLPGHRFTGWNTKADGTGTAYAAGASITMSTDGTFTLYAQWEIHHYTVTYNLNGGSAGQGADFSDQTYDYGQSLDLPPDPILEHYSFNGWYYEGIRYSQGDQVIENLQLTAAWIPDLYTLSYDVNGTGVQGITPQRTVEWGQTINLEWGGMQRPGYTLTGWNSMADGTGTHYQLNSVFSPAQAETHALDPNTLTISFYAEWTPTYTVSFVTGCDEVPAPDSQPIIQGYYATEPSPQRTGYTLVGWSVDGSLPAFNFRTTAITANITFRAIWQINSYTVSFDTQGGTPTAIDSQTVEYNSFAATPEAPVLEGFDFMGWSTDSTAAVGEPDISAIPITDHTTFCAIWQPITP